MPRTLSLAPQSMTASGGIPAVQAADTAAIKAPVAVFGDLDITEPFHAQLASLWPLWEVLLLGKPLMVFAQRPRECTIAVAALVSLISPLPYMPDFRPMLSIHDDDVHSMLVCASLYGSIIVLPVATMSCKYQDRYWLLAT